MDIGNLGSWFVISVALIWLVFWEFDDGIFVPRAVLPGLAIVQRPSKVKFNEAIVSNLNSMLNSMVMLSIVCDGSIVDFVNNHWFIVVILVFG